MNNEKNCGRIKIHPNKQGWMGDDVEIDDGGAQTNSLSSILHSSVALTHHPLKFWFEERTGKRRKLASFWHESRIKDTFQWKLLLCKIAGCLLAIKIEAFEWHLNFIRYFSQIWNSTNSYNSFLPDSNKITRATSEADNSGFWIESN